MNFNDDSGRFDLESALDRFSGDCELLDEAIAIFKEEAEKHLEQIKSSLAEQKLEMVKRNAHTLKGECGAVGAVTAQFLSAALEKAATNNDITSSQELFPQLEEEILTALKTLPDSILHH